MKIWIGAEKLFKQITLALAVIALMVGQVPVAYADTFNTISGTFTDRAGTPISNAALEFISTEGQGFQVFTDGNGNYSRNVSPGIYKLDVVGSTPASQFNLKPSGTNQYILDASISNVVQDLRLDTVTVNVSFVDQNNQPIANARVYGQNNDLGGSTSLITGHPDVLYSGSDNTNPLFTSAPNGVAEMTLLRGLTYNVCAINPTTNVHYCAQLTPVDDVSAVTLAVPGHYTISGHLSDRAGNPIPNATLDFISSEEQGFQVFTDGSGNYSRNVSPGIYKLDVVGSTPASQFSLKPNDSNQYVFDATSSNVIQDLQLDTVEVNVSFVDQNNQPISNARVYGQNNDFGGSTSLLVGNSDVRYSGSDNTNPLFTSAPNGVAGMTLLRGLTYNVCAINPTTNVHYCTQLTPVDDVSAVTLAVEGLPAPAGLTTQSPTNQSPVLSWSTVSGADYYDVYRDGNVVGSSTAPEFTDTTVTDGNHDYYVTAVGAGNVSSDPSNTISVIYDTIAPSIAYGINPVANVNGWHNGDVTISFDCADTLTSITACTSTVVLSIEGINQEIVGTVVDGVGNTATDTVTVNIDKTAPIITPNPSHAPNSNGWNNSDITVSFDCTDALSGVQSCTAPVDVTTEGANQTVNGMAVDNADNTASTSTTFNIDKTAPVLGTQSWSVNPLLQGQDTTLSIPASDTLSGLEGVKYSVDGGTQVDMTHDTTSDTWQATFGSNLLAGTYNVAITATDLAGNISVMNDVLAVYQPANGYVTGHANTYPTASDTLPIALDTSNNPAKLIIGFTNVTAPASGSFDMSYTIKNKKNAFSLGSTSISWVTVQDSTHASIQGVADLTTWVNGTQSVTTGVTVRFDIVLGVNGAPDHVTVQIWNPGVNPNIGVPAYVISNDVISNGSNLMIHP